MTQHVMPQDTLEDQRTLRRLALVTSVFIVATATMAVVIGLVMG
jgi:Na+/H+-dicarboxylate symporter